LHYAALHNQYDYRSPALINILLEARADINAKNGEGKTALDTAKENNNMQAVKILAGKTKKK
jgi:ankyrin repeat protein